MVHEPLISAELFKRVQEQRHPRSHVKQSKHNYLFRGLFQCHTCYNSMTPEKQRGRVYYRCHRRDCKGNSIREDVLEERITNILAGLEPKQKDIDQFLSELDRRLSRTIKQPQKDIAQAKYKKIEAAKERLLDALTDGVIDAQTYQRKLQELNLSQVEMSNKQENHLSEEKQKQQIAQFLELSKSLAQTYQIASPAEKRQLLNLCFSNMTVIDKKVEIARKNWLQRVVSGPSVLDGAPSRIRTYVGNFRRIYSPLHLTTLPSTHILVFQVRCI